MKVVGGPFDGQEYPVERGQHVVRVLERSEPVVVPFPGPLSPVGAVVKTFDYTVRSLRFRRQPNELRDATRSIFDPEIDELKYLAPADWSDFKAVVHQFTK